MPRHGGTGWNGALGYTYMLERWDSCDHDCAEISAVNRNNGIWLENTLTHLKWKKFFLKVLIASSFFFKLFPTCRLCWHCIPILVKLSTRYGRQHQAYFIIKRLLIKTLFIIDKESYYRSRHVLLDAVYILIYWWNMCHCHLKNQHQFIINLLWKTFESWKINCKKEKRKRQCCAM